MTDDIVRCKLCEGCGEPIPSMIIGLTAYSETIAICGSCVEHGYVVINDRRVCIGDSERG